MVTAEEQMRNLGVTLPTPPTPLGAYVEAVQTGNLLFLSGILPVVNHKPKFLGRLGKELDTKAGREAAYTAALNVLAVARQYLGSLDKIARLVKLGVFISSTEDILDLPQVADGASELFQDIFGKEKLPTRQVIGVASLPLGVPIELEVVFEII
ncbi:MAG: RidA family protein [Verrucomicrobia bacterium]|nr:RidA family protein [Verrucomicrobiota bacterium]